MSEIDNGYRTNGNGSREAGPMPFFPAPPSPAAGPPPSMPLAAPVPSQATPTTPRTPSSGRHSQTAEQPLPAPVPAQGSPPAAETSSSPSSPPSAGPGTAVKGRIKVEDEVIEKIAALAVLEVEGIAHIGGARNRAMESAHDPTVADRPPAGQGVNVKVHDNEVSLDVTVVVEYGSVVMEVAKAVKTNVARVTSRMLGMRVTSVNITVDDVRMPGEDE